MATKKSSVLLLVQLVALIASVNGNGIGECNLYCAEFDLV